MTLRLTEAEWAAFTDPLHVPELVESDFPPAGRTVYDAAVVGLLAWFLATLATSVSLVVTLLVRRILR